MSKLTNVNRCNQEVFDQIASGSYSEEYDDNAIYQVELAPSIEIGTLEGSGVHVDTNNNLVAEIPQVVRL